MANGVACIEGSGGGVPQLRKEVFVALYRNLWLNKCDGRHGGTAEQIYTPEAQVEEISAVEAGL